MSVSDNPDLRRERRSASFNVCKLTDIVYGGSDKNRRRKEIEEAICRDPNFLGPDENFLSRPEDFLETTRRHVAFIQKLQEMKVTDPQEIAAAMAVAVPRMSSSLSFTGLAFSPPIALMGSDEQCQKWLPLANSYQILGAYAQTELGHGSHVRGIETRADYDKLTKEFVLNTPDISSTKWWSGSLGVAATHAIIMAQLYTNGKCHGVHPFIAQIRDMKTHKPLAGIEVGDQGPKFGLNTVDNGFMRLKNVRIPRENLLQKTGQVLDDGTYVKPNNMKLVYGGMLGIRAQLPQVAAVQLMRAVTITIRYSCVRRQSEIKPGDAEPQVMDFQTQQHKLFPLLAQAYAFHFVGRWVLEFHNDVMKELNAEDFSRLPEDHVLTAGLKAVTNWKSHEAIEVCRLACGGHGYSLASGLPTLYMLQVANSTAEGETTVLLLQTAKYLLKCLMDLQQGQRLDPSVRYLAEKLPETFTQFDSHGLLRALQFRAYKTLEVTGGKIHRDFMDTGEQHAALNRNSVVMTKLAQVHIEVVILTAFVNKVEEIRRTDPDIARVLDYLCQIYAILEILKDAAAFLQYNYMTSSQLDRLRDSLLELYAKVRPEAVSLVDSFDFHDRALGSILGRYDGNVYENLYKWAKQSPLNKSEVHESFVKYLKPLKQAKL